MYCAIYGKMHPWFSNILCGWGEEITLFIIRYTLDLATGFPGKRYIYIFKKVKFSRYRPSVAQRMGRGIALPFHDRGTRRGWVVSSTPRPHFTPRKDPVPILQEAGWAPGPVWMGRKICPHQDSILDHPAHSLLLYWLSYPAHTHTHTHTHTHIYIYIYTYIYITIRIINIKA